MPFLRDAFGSLCYNDSGGSGFPLIFVHGFPFDQTMWEPQLERFKGAFRVISYDHRGHGQSQPAYSAYSLEYLVDDFFSVLNHLALPKVVACGLSMGGYVLLRAAERDAGRFDGLILADTRSDADSNEAKEKRSSNMRMIQSGRRADFQTAFLKGALSPTTFQNNPTAVQIIKTMMENTPESSLVGSLLAMASRTDCTEALSQFSFPVLTLVGENDKITPPPVVEAMSQKFTTASHRVISDAGHVSNLENIEAFNAVVASFLKPWIDGGKV